MHASNINLLNEEFGKGIYVPAEDDVIWHTPYGVTFMTPADINENSKVKYDLDSMYSFKYDTSIEFPFIHNMDCHGHIYMEELSDVITQLKTNPTKLRSKPNSIIELEQITGIKAHRIDGFFGTWQIYCDNYSMFNNPFNCKTGYANSENNFELYINKLQKTFEYISVDKIKALLLTHKLIK